MQNKRRRLVLTVLATLAALLLCSAAPAAVPLPAEAAAVLENGYWKDYTIPCATHGDAAVENHTAAAGYDENGHAAAFAMQQKEGRNILCVLEKNKKGEWRVSAWSERAVWQGKQIPQIENETYGKFTLFYFKTCIIYRYNAIRIYFRHISKFNHFIPPIWITYN